MLHVLQHFGRLAGFNCRGHRTDEKNDDGRDGDVEGVSQVVVAAGDDEDVVVVQSEEDE